MSTASDAVGGSRVFGGTVDIAPRIERLPITSHVFWTLNIIGAATFLDGYTVPARRLAPSPQPSLSGRSVALWKNSLLNGEAQPSRGVARQ
ncbi:hypothetical protein [Roseomonas sp. KE2513]|uniref:hypothetical protein n=1 Tax=Roseomonas sp. KE2513 TaxID=2479202 RepID=UPI0018DFB3A5|nr:hypothetical protein [Roseomonas sp. KE2513]